MSDESLEKLGTYFVHLNIYSRFGIPFHRFIMMVQQDVWKGYIVAFEDVSRMSAHTKFNYGEM